MAYTPRVTREVFLEGVRGAWYGLDKADFKYPNNPTFGVGAILNDKAAQALNAATREVEKDSGEKGQSYAAGDTVRIRMSAETRDKKTGEITKFRPHVYMLDLTPATDEEIAKLGRNSKFTLKVRVASYAPIGKAEEGQPPKTGGISVKFVALRIDTFDAGAPSAEEQGFTASVGEEEEGF
jgi:hypothetical protein